ncbi:MAG: hypothetical protein IJD58_05615 [Lachnospiraceae bacterium]|nr:hypothetical protein [Lachnospiraceae bacterium]
MKKFKRIVISFALGTLLLVAVVPSKAIVKRPSITVSSGTVIGTGTRPVTK